MYIDVDVYVYNLIKLPSKVPSWCLLGFWTKPQCSVSYSQLKKYIHEGFPKIVIPQIPLVFIYFDRMVDYEPSIYSGSSI